MSLIKKALDKAEQEQNKMNSDNKNKSKNFKYVPDKKDKGFLSNIKYYVLALIVIFIIPLLVTMREKTKKEELMKQKQINENIYKKTYSLQNYNENKKNEKQFSEIESVPEYNNETIITEEQNGEVTEFENLIAGTEQNKIEENNKKSELVLSENKTEPEIELKEILTKPETEKNKSIEKKVVEKNISLVNIKQLLNKGDKLTSLSLLKKFCENNPDNSEAINLLAELNYNLGYYEDAVKYFKTAYTLTGDIEYYFKIGICYNIFLKNQEQAKYFFEIYLNKNGEYKDKVKKMLERM